MWGMQKSVLVSNGISLHEPIRAYAAVNKTQQQLEKSASGGAFSAVATYFLKNESVVYGAALDFEGGHPIAHLVGIDDASQLWRLQGSKYVQSAVEQTYKQAKQNLDAGKRFFFQGHRVKLRGCMDI